MCYQEEWQIFWEYQINKIFLWKKTTKIYLNFIIHAGSSLVSVLRVLLLEYIGIFQWKFFFNYGRKIRWGCNWAEKLWQQWNWIGLLTIKKIPASIWKFENYCNIFVSLLYHSCVPNLGHIFHTAKFSFMFIEERNHQKEDIHEGTHFMRDLCEISLLMQWPSGGLFPLMRYLSLSGK